MLLYRSFILSSCLTLASSQITACATSSSTRPTAPSIDRKIAIQSIQASAPDYADQKLKEAGFKPGFIQLLHHSFVDQNPNWKEEAERLIELNIFGFLAHSNYAVHDTPRARAHIKAYLKQHRKSFREARRQYGVSSAAIASLMWVETKHGKVMGKYPIAWVYYALSMADHPDFVRAMLPLLPAKLANENPKNLTLVEAEQKVVDRCHSKSMWAIDEMKAVSFIYEARFFNPMLTRSSFAGAFGLGQFIPSTYLKFAESHYRKNADLFKDSDAILSIAHFLKENGWTEGNLESKITALYSYNRSRDYGSIILQLASAFEPR